MSLNTLKIATAGYLKRGTKAVLIIAVAGYLNFSDVPPPPPPSPSGGSGGSSESHRLFEHEQEQKRKKIKVDDANIISVLKIYLSACH